MLYQLPSGKCIEISIDYFLKLTDEEILEFVCLEIGRSTENPFRINPINIKSKPSTYNNIDPEDEENHIFKKLNEYSSIEKFNDRDYHNKDDE